jgi:hypothetical protein
MAPLIWQFGLEHNATNTTRYGEMTMWAIMIGSPVEGFQMCGPFSNQEDAVYYIENVLDDTLEAWAFKMT